MKPEIVVQSGHISRIFKCSFSPDGNLLLTTSNDETVRLWDLRLGCELRVFNGHRGPVYDACFSPDGSLIASVSYDRTLRIWETATGQARTIYDNFPRHLYQVQFDASGAFLSAGGSGEIAYNDPGKIARNGSEFDIYVWDTQTGQLARKFNFPIYSIGLTTGFLVIRSGSVLATYGQKQKLLFLHDLASGNEIARIKVQSVNLGRDLNVYNQISITPDGRTLILSSNRALPQLIDLASQRVTGSLPAAEPFHRIQVNPDGTLVGFGEKSVELWDLEKTTRIRTIPVAAEAASPDLKLLAGIENLKIVLWDAGSGREIWRMGSALSMHEFYGNRARLFPLASNPNFPMVAAGGPDGFIRIWDLRSGKGPMAIKAHDGRVNALAFDPAGTQLASGSNQGNVKIWQPSTGELIAEVGVPKGESGPPIEALGFSPDGHFLIIDTEVQAECVDLQQGQVQTLEHPHNPFPGAGIVFQPDNKHFFSSIIDSVLYWDVESGHPSFYQLDVTADDLKVPDQEVVLAIRGGRMMTLKFEPIITALAADSAGRIAFAYGYFQWVHGQMLNQNPQVQMDRPALVALFDPSEGKLQNLRGGSPFVRAIGINNEGNRVATGCSDGSVTLWNLAESDTPISWQAHSSDVSGVSFTSDGRFLATIGLDSAVRLWKADTHEQAATMVCLNDSDYVIVNADSFYTATRGALPSVVFRLGQRALPFDQFDLTLNRPDRVYESLGYAYSDLLDSYELAYRHRLQKLDFTPEQVVPDYDLPTLSLVSGQPPIATQERTLTLGVKARSSEYNLDRLLVYVNDVPVPGRSGIDVRGEGKEVERTVGIQLSAGDNKIQLSALNAAGVESLRETMRVAYTGDSSLPDLYVMAVGVSEYRRPELNLKYAGKDARDLAAAIAKLQTHFGAVKKRVLSDSEASKEAILDGRNFLAQTRVDDQVIVFFAGHGILYGSDYYFLPADFDPAAVEKTGLRYDEIEGLLDGIPARRRLVLLDTCHAGEADYVAPAGQGARGPVKATEVSSFRQVEVFTKRPKGARRMVGDTDRVLAELFADLRRSSGAFIIAASGASEFAIETARLKNGVFTHCVLKALRQSRADRNKDGLIRVSELHQYVSEQVVALTGGRQRPISRRENLANDFSVI